MFGIEGLKEENDGRGWLLLEHLAQWQEWQQTAGNPFYGKVDMERIVLMGHSRGGEAAAIAAAFNRLPAYPDDATVSF
jgi:predicted dienelactone hydrolase